MNSNIDYIAKLKEMKVNRSGNVISLHKPVLLLVAIADVLKGCDNLFLYDTYEEILSTLLSKYGLKNTKKLSPQYPFVYLASSKHLWLCSVDKQSLKHPDAASRSEVLGATAEFTPGFYNFIRSENNGFSLIQYILDSYWPESYHEDILSDIGISISNNINQKTDTSEEKNRSRYFVEEVLDVYERKCAVCMQSIRLGDSLVGIDACHLKPLQHFGNDDISNGIALCKTHHWALDRGAYSIDHEFRVMLSPKLNGVKMDDYFTSFENRQIFVPRNQSKQLNIDNIEYHNKYIFFK